MTCYDDKECKAWPRAGIFMTKERKAFNSSSINSMSDNFSKQYGLHNNYSSIQFTGWLPDNININNNAALMDQPMAPLTTMFLMDQLAKPTLMRSAC
jgi:hypothetical protein